MASEVIDARSNAARFARSTTSGLLHCGHCVRADGIGFPPAEKRLVEEPTRLAAQKVKIKTSDWTLLRLVSVVAVETQTSGPELQAFNLRRFSAEPAMDAVFYCTRGRAQGRASACDNSTDHDVESEGTSRQSKSDTTGLRRPGRITGRWIHAEALPILGTMALGKAVSDTAASTPDVFSDQISGVRTR